MFDNGVSEERIRRLRKLQGLSNGHFKPAANNVVAANLEAVKKLVESYNSEREKLAGMADYWAPAELDRRRVKLNETYGLQAENLAIKMWGSQTELGAIGKQLHEVQTELNAKLGQSRRVMIGSISESELSLARSDMNSFRGVRAFIDFYDGLSAGEQTCFQLIRREVMSRFEMMGKTERLGQLKNKLNGDYEAGIESNTDVQTSRAKLGELQAVQREAENATVAMSDLDCCKGQAWANKGILAGPGSIVARLRPGEAMHMNSEFKTAFGE